jgi:hypothetical protein
MAQSPVEAQRIIGQVSAQALTDEAYRTRLQNEPKAVLSESGLELPEGLNVKIYSQFDAIPAGEPNTLNLVVGAHADQLSHEELSAVAGGGTCQSTASTFFCIPSCASSSSTASTICQ